MFCCDQKTLQFLAVNDAAIGHYGYSRTEFLSMTAKDIRPPQDVPALIEHVANQKAPSVRAGVWQHRKKDGTIIDVDVTWHRVEFSGHPSFLVLANDITEKRKSETALRESEQRYRENFDNANDLIYTHESGRHFTSLNETGDNFTGYLENRSLEHELRTRSSCGTG